MECSWATFTPELSYGTHFFGDMVVTNTLYIPVFRNKGDHLNVKYLETHGEAKSFEGVRVVDSEKGFDVYVDGRNRSGLIVRRKAAGRRRRPAARRVDRAGSEGGR